MGVSNLTEKRVKNVKPSGISDHILECDCSTDICNFDILAADASNFNLLIKDLWQTSVKQNIAILPHINTWPIPNYLLVITITFTVITDLLYFLILPILSETL